MKVLGFTTCLHCGIAVIEETAWKSGGLCPKCFRAEMELRTQPIEVTHRKARITTTLGHSPSERARRARKNRRKHERRIHDPELRARRRKVARAKERALRRLRMLYPEAYDLLLAEERARDGLDPWPNHQSRLLGVSGADAFQTLPTTAAYHAHERYGPEDLDEEG
jgi:hypothetical protein